METYDVTGGFNRMTQEELDERADRGGVLVSCGYTFGCPVASQEFRFGYRTKVRDTQGMGNHGYVVLVAEAGTPQYARLKAGWRAWWAEGIEGRARALGWDGDGGIDDACDWIVATADAVATKKGEFACPGDLPVSGDWFLSVQEHGLSDRYSTARLRPRTLRARNIAREWRIAQVMAYTNVPYLTVSAVVLAGEKIRRGYDIDVLRLAASIRRDPDYLPRSNAAAEKWTERYAPGFPSIGVERTQSAVAIYRKAFVPA